MKKIFALIFILGFYQNNFAQLPPSDFMYCLNRPEIQKEDLMLTTGTYTLIDENVKWALNKFWVKPASIKLISSTAKTNLSCSYMSIVDLQTTGETGNFYNTHFRVTNEMKSQDPNIIFDIAFDNFIAKDDEKVVIGSDKYITLVADKALIYTMLFCSVAKNFSNDFGSFRKAINGYNDYMEKAKEKIKTTTMLIPKELMDNGLTKEGLAGLNIKYEIIPSADIAKRIKEGNNVKNYSELLVYKADKMQDYAYLVDIETGDLISYANMGGGIISKTYKYMDDKRFNKLMTKLIN
ncbi:MAG: hypothetical protein H0W73_14315 [Bacteroidetes bacterium]|nr:hypothetical protein [Bacteroidota bacterium]